MSDNTQTERFEHVGLNCKLVKQSRGHWCGYVQRPDSVEPVRWTSDFDSKHDQIVEAEVDVWGGITYGPDEDGWVGFDDAHSRSLAEHLDLNDDHRAVKEETKHLAEQITELQENYNVR